MLLRDSGPVRPGEIGRLGQALITREGTDITLVGYSYTAKLVLQAAEALSRVGISAEAVDMRSISPLDTATVATSARKTRRLLVVQEAYKPFGVGAEILASVASEGIQLRLPPRRIAVPFMPIPALKALERAYLPTVESVTAAAVQMCNEQS